jgi:hypothetical protein
MACFSPLTVSLLRPRGGRIDSIMIFNGCVAVAIGAISGRYIFKEPLENYWKNSAAQKGQEKPSK